MIKVSFFQPLTKKLPSARQLFSVPQTGALTGCYQLGQLNPVNEVITPLPTVAQSGVGQAQAAWSLLISTPCVMFLLRVWAYFYAFIKVFLKFAMCAGIYFVASVSTVHYGLSLTYKHSQSCSAKTIFCNQHSILKKQVDPRGISSSMV